MELQCTMIFVNMVIFFLVHLAIGQSQFQETIQCRETPLPLQRDLVQNQANQSAGARAGPGRQEKSAADSRGTGPCRSSAGLMQL